MSIQRSCHVQVHRCADVYLTGGAFGHLSLKWIWCCSWKSLLLCKRGFAYWLGLPSWRSVSRKRALNMWSLCHLGISSQVSDECWWKLLRKHSEEQSERLSNDSALGDSQLSACLWCDWSEAKSEERDCVALDVPKNNWQWLACVWEDLLLGRAAGHRREHWTRGAQIWRRPSFSTWSVSLQGRLVGSAGYMDAVF